MPARNLIQRAEEWRYHSWKEARSTRQKREKFLATEPRHGRGLWPVIRVGDLAAYETSRQAALAAGVNARTIRRAVQYRRPIHGRYWVRATRRILRLLLAGVPWSAIDPWAESRGKALPLPPDSWPRRVAAARKEKAREHDNEKRKLAKPAARPIANGHQRPRTSTVARSPAGLARGRADCGVDECVGTATV